MYEFVSKVSKGGIPLPKEVLPQTAFVDNIPEKGVACPQCDTVFVADIVRECLFCGYKEGRAIDPDKELRYKMKCSEGRR